MTVIIADRAVADQVMAARSASGRDRWDEVWDGDYFMSPAPNNEHADIATQLAAILTAVVHWRGLGRVQQGCNISDQAIDWTTNFRVPDVAVFLQGNPAEDRETHWFGGPDLAIEIVSEEDRTWKKIPFYGAVGTQELLIIDRDPWMLTLFRSQGTAMQEAGCSKPSDGQWTESAIISLRCRLVGDIAAPTIEVHDRVGNQQWKIATRNRQQPS